MEGPCGRKLSIMSTVLPNTPSQKSKEQKLGFLGGYVRQNKGAHHEHQQGFGGRKASNKSPRSYMEGPRGGKASCKTSQTCIWKDASPSCMPQEGGRARRRARASPPSLRGVPSARAGFFLYIYLSISAYLSLYMIYIYIYISLALSLSRSSFWRRLRRAHMRATKLQ